MRKFIKYVFKITFYILIINSFVYLTAFSQTNLDNFFAGDFSTNKILARQFAKERQLLSVNLLPRHSIIFPSFVNSLYKNIETFSGLAKINLNDIKLSDSISAKDILNIVNIKGSFWYIPNISYTLLLNKVIGIELGIGVQSVSYSLNIPKDKMPDFLNRMQSPDMPVSLSELVKALRGENIGFKSSFYYIPIHLGLKIISGRTHKTVNTFRLGLETVVYNIDTENIFSGETRRSSTVESTFYISYELGWQIDLFPNKNWRVKPYIDFSLFEIGVYIKSANKGIYEEIRNSLPHLSDTSAVSKLPFASGLNLETFNLNFLPEWDSFPKAVGFVTSLKIAIFPRVGFTIRF